MNETEELISNFTFKDSMCIIKVKSTAFDWRKSRWNYIELRSIELEKGGKIYAAVSYQHQNRKENQTYFVFDKQNQTLRVDNYKSVYLVFSKNGYY